MKALQAFALACVLMYAASCKPASTTGTVAADTTTTAAQKALDPKAFNYNYHPLEGMYGGDFGGSDIRIVLRHITPTTAIGYNLHNGLRRNISGSVEMAEKGIQFTLSEPGDDAYDGTFLFVIDTSASSLNGSWKPKNSGSTAEKTYTLKRVAKDTASEEVQFGNSWQEGESDNLLTFLDDGLCTYRYYPAEGQMEELRGNWVKTAEGYTLYWQKNKVLPEKMMMVQKKHEQMSTLSGAGHEFRIIFVG